MSQQTAGDNRENVKQSRIMDRRAYLKTVGATGGGLALGGLGLSETGTESVEAATTVIDDFEDGDLSEYSFDRGSSGASVVSSPAYSGSYVLEFSGTNTEAISTFGLNAYPSAGDTFSFWVRTSGGGDNLNVTWGVQDHDNRYYAKLYPTQGEFYLFTYKSATGSTEDSDSGLSLSQDTWYEIEVDWATDGTQKVTLYDSSGSQLSQLSMTDTEWSSGGIGYDAYLSSGESVYFDYVTIDASGSGDVSETVIDDFEDGSLSAYTHDPTRENSSASIVSSSDGHPTHSGGQALAIENTNTEMISLPGDGLESYPSAGDTFGCWIRGTGGTGILNFTYGVQDHENRYYVQVHFGDNEIHWFKLDSGSGDWRDSGSASLDQDTWYQIVDWGANGSHSVKLKDKTSTTLATASASDSAWMQGGIGFDSYLASDDGTVYFDYATIYRAPGGGTSYITEYFDEDSTISKLKQEYTGTMDGEHDPVEVVSYGSGLFRGDNAVKLTWPDSEGAQQGQIFSKGNQIYQPREGEKFSTMMKPKSDSRPIVYYGITDTNRYSVEIYDNYMGPDNTPQYRISYIVRRETRSDTSSSWEVAWQDGEVFDASRSEFSVSDTNWFELEIDWQSGGTHTVTLYAWDGQTFLDRREVRSYTAEQPSPVKQGTYGLKCAQGRVYYDNLFIDDGYPINYDNITNETVAPPETIEDEAIEGCMQPTWWNEGQTRLAHLTGASHSTLECRQAHTEPIQMKPNPG